MGDNEPSASEQTDNPTGKNYSTIMDIRYTWLYSHAKIVVSLAY